MRVHGGDIYKVARKVGIAPDELLDFSSNINLLGYPPGLKEELFAGFDTIRSYPDIDAFEVKERLAQYHNLWPEQIVVGNGATELIHIIPLALKPRWSVVVEPAFAEYEAGLFSAGIAVFFIQTAEDTDFLTSPEEVTSIIESVGPDSILWLANPTNPAGTAYGTGTLERIIEEATELGAKVVLDEVFIDFIEERSMKHALSTYPGLIILRSFTKFFGIPGLRIGYILCSASVARQIEAIKQPWSVNSLAQKAVIYCLSSSQFIEESRKKVKKLREELKKELAKIDGLTPVGDSVANFLLVRIDNTKKDSTLLRERLIKRKILIRDCSSMKGMGKRYFRVCVRNRKDNEKLVEALKEELSKT